jgi:putative glycosyltransferase (TIGR04372 family)
MRLLLKSKSWGFGNIYRMRKRGVRAVIRKLVKIGILILVSPIAVILLVFGIRFSSGNTNHRIGHLVGEPLFMELQNRAGRHFFRFFILLLPGERVANPAVLKAFPNNFFVFHNSLVCKFLSIFQWHPLTKVDMSRGIVSMSGPAFIFKYTHLTSVLKPFLKIPRRGQPEVEKFLSSLGVPINGWYVCLHNREAGYSPIDDEAHAYRNASISNFEGAINYISELGGTVIRMGDSSMQKLAINLHAIDYANSELRSPQNDLILAANCRFFLGNTSGLLGVAAAQGIPCVGVNLAPAGAAKFWGPNDIALPKIYRRVLDDTIIAFTEVFDSGLADFRFAHEFAKAGVYLQENSPDEILEVCREMVERLGGAETSSHDTDLQHRFLSLYRENNYSYFSKTKFSNYFLKKYQDYY